MTSLVYDFKFGPTGAGLNAAVTDAAGSPVAASPVTLDSNGASSLTLDAGTYTADTSSPTADGALHLRTVGVVNIAASIEVAATLPAGP